MVRLETVEDFERVKANLKDQDSKPRYYCVRPYSYCAYCDEVKEFESTVPGSSGEMITVKCLGCDHLFFVDDHRCRDNILWGGSSIVNRKASSEHLAEMNRLNSRELQRIFFVSVLEERIAREKSESRNVQGRIQDFARLRFWPSS